MESPTPFVGRKRELEELGTLIRTYNSSLVVLNGRRRIGKSRLAKEFAKDKILLEFLGDPPTTETTEQSQRDIFAEKLAKYCPLPSEPFTTWTKVFETLSAHIMSINPSKQVVILFDEISWMGSLDHMFIPRFKTWWDSWDALAEPHPHFVLILCGSISTWIEKNIINSTALYGRLYLQRTLTDLSLPEAHQLLIANGVDRSTIDIAKILSITGGVPWYLNQIKSEFSVDDNIKKLCFEKDGIFVREYHKIFHDLFQDEGPLHKQILERLAKGMCDIPELKRHFRPTKDDPNIFTQCLDNLMIAGFVTQHYSWQLKTGTIDKQHYIYSLSDNYLRFYLKYISPNLDEIQNNTYENVPLSQTPGWQAIMGFQVENLIVKNRHALVDALGLSRVDIVRDNPYIQRPMEGSKGCQIDYLIQTTSNNLYVCEFKFSKNELGPEVIQSVEEKVTRLVIPEGFGVLRILIHVGGVSKSVLDKKYFHRIINISELL